MTKLTQILVYEWQAWNGFLISHLIADYCRLSAEYQHDISDFEAVLNPNIKAVLLQINLSYSVRFPAQRAQLIEALQAKGLLVLNQAVGDISKSNLHALLQAHGIASAKADKDGDPDDYLFVKSNLNWGGVAEQRLPKALQKHFPDVAQMRIKRHDQYYLRQRKKLTEEEWSDQSIVIEKYIANDENSFYRVYAFGESLVVVKAYTIGLIKKISGDGRDRNFLYSKSAINDGCTELPDGLNCLLKQFIRHIDLCFFCLDIVHDDERYYIIDLNLTPWSGVQEQSQEAVNFLCRGAKQYLQGRLAS